jgi:hypothetical protein
MHAPTKYTATNVQTHQLLAGFDGPGTQTLPFTYKASGKGHVEG